jgi:SAM-dependent methyltransferase
VRGYDEASYGDGMADVYDEWYGATPATEACLAALDRLAGPGPVLELGAGTGRLALPLAALREVHALDGSVAMLERLRAKPGGERVHVHLAGLAGPYPPGPFSLVFVAVNTFFGLTSEAGQRQAFRAVAACLAPGGRFVVEAFVPAAHQEGDRVEVRDLAADRVVLSISRTDTASQSAIGQFVELRDGEPVRLRPWAIRWSTPEQLDAMAADSGLEREERWADWAGNPFVEDSDNHVTIYRAAPSTPADVLM